MSKKNLNEENKLQRKKISPKNQVHQPIAKYIPPHLIKDKNQSLRKEERKPILPLAIMTRKPQHRTLNIKGVTKDRNITILIDSGSTYNCIDIDVTKKLNYFIYPTRDLTIKVSNGQGSNKLGNVIKYQFKCKN
jgi:hypothetical protein